MHRVRGERNGPRVMVDKRWAKIVAVRKKPGNPGLFIFLVRKGGFEPPRYCYRQPLKLVRLPVPPLPRTEGLQLVSW